MKKTPGVDMTAGSLGQGLSVGVGMALSARVLKKDYHVWVVIGDGETQEGAIWEAAMAGARWKLSNLTAVLDKNGLQNDNFVNTVMPIDPVVDKWRAFGWNAIEIDGHDMAQIVETLERVREVWDRPTVVIARTIKGKGVSFMENVPEWHGKAPNENQMRQALREIEGATI